MSDPTAGPASPIQYVVEGGHRLSGTIAPAGNKNAALPIIAAALLSEHPVTLENVPRIRDTETLVELVRSVGASAEWRERNTLDIHAKAIRAADLDPVLCARIRASILLAGPLLGPLRRGDAAAARRRRHRPAASRHAFPGVRAARRQRHGQRAAAVQGVPPQRRRRLPRRAERDRDRKRADGRGGRPRHHATAQRRLRAACAGPRPFPGGAGG